MWRTACFAAGMLFRTLALVAMLSATARADRYVELGAMLGGRVSDGGDPDEELGNVGQLGVAVGTRASDDLWLRGAAMVGLPIGDLTGGKAGEVRIGFERRGRAYVGVDLALSYNDSRDSPDEATMLALLAIPRAGVELGGDSWRLRLGLGLALGVGRVHDREPDLAPPLDAVSYRLAGGLELETGVVAQF